MESLFLNESLKVSGFHKQYERYGLRIQILMILHIIPQKDLSIPEMNDPIEY